MIRLLQRKKIDDERWNGIIAASGNETIYPYTWYMDACSVQWAGYVMQDYECIMPIAIKKKMGLKYAYQPFYCQQLGIFSEKPVDPEIVRMFLLKVYADFRVADYGFNAGNMLGEEQGIDVTDHANHLLQLALSYEKLVQGYTESCRRNIKRAKQSSLKFTDKVTVEEAVALKKLTAPVQRSAEHYMAVRNQLEQLQQQDKITLAGLRSNDLLHAVAVFAISRRRYIYLLSASSEAGKQERAMFHIIDTFIRMHAGEDRVLDFEGSSIPSIARFYAGFGAKPEVYPRITYNRLSPILKKIVGHD
jgi:hypothetical protein